MDVTLNVQSARIRLPLFGSLVLGSLALSISLSQRSLAESEVVFASDAPTTESSAVFITDDAPTAPPQAPESVQGSVVFVEDTPAPAQPEPKPQRGTARFVAPQMPVAEPQARGELKVVTAEVAPAPKPLAVRPTSKQQPLQPISKPAVVQLPVVLPQTEIQPVASTSERDQPGDIQIAVHAEPPAPAPKQVRPKRKSPAALLIEAYKLSITAETSPEYTQIIDWCTQARRFKLKRDQFSFANKLAAWALNRRGQLRAESGEQELADADFEAAIKHNPSNWRALHNRGVSYAQAGSFAEAFDDFTAVIQLNPKYPKAYANRATLYVQAKDLGSAIQDYERAIQHDDQFATAHVGLGRVYHMLGEWDDALDHFSAAIEIEPKSPDVVCSRGDLQADMGNYAGALADYARTIEIDSEFGHAYRNGAWLLATCPIEEFRDPENAVLGAQQALEYSYGERHVALDTLAAALASNGQFEEAIDTVKQAVDLAPEGSKFTYLSRLELYQESQPFRTDPIENVSQAAYEVSDQ